MVHVLKNITARESHGELWADGYHVGSAGDHVISDLVKWYIEYQESEDAGHSRLL